MAVFYFRSSTPGGAPRVASIVGGVMKVEVYKCDGCGKLIEKETDVWVLRLEQLVGYIDPASGRENKPLEKHLHFCPACAAFLKDVLKAIYERLTQEDER